MRGREGEGKLLRWGCVSGRSWPKGAWGAGARHLHLISVSEPEEVTEGVSSQERHDLVHSEPLWLWGDNECTVDGPERPQGDQSLNCG